MSILEAIILGIIQGATEFLPISSSGHLVLGKAVLGLANPQLLFDIILHVGTLLSVMVFYRQDIWMVIRDTFKGLGQWRQQKRWQAFLEPQGVRLAALVVMATIPTGIIGLLIKDFVDPESNSGLITPAVVCGLLIFNGFILMANAFFQKREDERSEDTPVREGTWTLWHIAPWVALLIGIAQGIAVAPGLSRSGLTITVALALSVQRIHAARFSFLLSIPAILGALVLKLDPAAFSGGEGSSVIFAFVLGAISAAVVGYVCLLLLTRMLKKAQFHHFSWYCWLVGVGGLIYYYVLQ